MARRAGVEPDDNGEQDGGGGGVEETRVEKTMTIQMTGFLSHLNS